MQLYLVCHATRFDVRDSGTAGEGAGPETCWLEKWRTESASVGERALAQLRKGVEQAISLLGTGFIAHPANPQLRHRLAAGELRLDDLNRALLRVVYRVLFWFVAEDRDALLLPIPAGSDAENVSAETIVRGRLSSRRREICGLRWAAGLMLLPGQMSRMVTGAGRGCCGHGGWPGGHWPPGLPLMARYGLFPSRGVAASCRTVRLYVVINRVLPGAAGFAARVPTAR
ncbi:MAG TPA: hypothetical protein VI365_26085, partial [Trebonia sp.]